MTFFFTFSVCVLSSRSTQPNFRNPSWCLFHGTFLSRCPASADVIVFRKLPNLPSAHDNLTALNCSRTRSTTSSQLIPWDQYPLGVKARILGSSPVKRYLSVELRTFSAEQQRRTYIYLHSYFSPRTNNTVKQFLRVNMDQHDSARCNYSRNLARMKRIRPQRGDSLRLPEPEATFA